MIPIIKGKIENQQGWHIALLICNNSIYANKIFLGYGTSLAARYSVHLL
jgi:hypothetical protein